MAYEPKPNTGVLFKNDKKNDKQPDYTGNILLETGEKKQLAAWIKEGQKGKFLSILMSDPKPSNGTVSQGSTKPNDNGTDDSLPF